MVYSYLLVSTGIALAGILSALAIPRYRRFVVISGILATPAGLADWIFVPAYWRPEHLIGPWFSLEGMLFSFGNGCLVMMPVAMRWPYLQTPLPNDLVDPLKRLTVLMLLGIGAFLLVWESGLGWLMIMHATFFGFAVIALILWHRGCFSIEIALTAGIGFALLYGVETLIWHWIVPEFKGFWAAKDAYWYSLPFPPGLPIEEYVWAFGYGAVWANLMLHGFDARLQKQAPTRPT